MLPVKFLLLILFITLLQILVGVYVKWILKDAKAGKGGWFKRGKKVTSRQWQAALQKGESIQMACYGQLDGSQLTTLSQIFGETPLYMLALTDFGRFLIAPCAPLSIGAIFRKFLAYDRLSVSFDSVVIEEPDFMTRLIPSSMSIRKQMDSFYSATLILPDARVRLNHLCGSLVDALRR